ncbi:MAG TPA: histidine kinase N-terminal domain-containing protein [Acidimicrobiales bacterium]|jgi:two-component sensor histidine kinase|nr:histidine kinase N-terminal domain-containing protein [Acidimicrobiales bacterium]
MASIAELAREHGGLDAPRVEHLQRLVRSWGLLADLSFSDLLLFGRASGDFPGKIVLLGHVRPTTAQTIYRTDLVGELFDTADRDVVRRAFDESRIVDGEITLIGPTEPVRVQAVPVRWHGEVLAVLTRETLPPLARQSSDLERTYLAVFGRLARMIEAGTYPFARDPDDQYKTPRVGDGVIVVDGGGRVEYNSPNAVSALHRLGVHVNAEGFTLGELGVDDTFARTALSTRAPVIVELAAVPDVTVVLNCIPLIERRAVTGGLVLVRDISELRRRDRMLLSKDATIREIHHRVKNNLQTISSLLHLQSRRLSSREARDAVEESVRRIESIAVVHETLAQEIGDEVAFLDVVRPLVRMVEEGLSSPERPVRFHITGDAGVLPAQIVTPLAVVVTELLQNAVEHAYPTTGDREAGHVLVELGRHGGTVRVRVVDDGVGVPEGFSLDSVGLGLTIVRTLLETDLGGTIEMRRRAGAAGTFVELRVPVLEPDEP